MNKLYKMKKILLLTLLLSTSVSFGQIMVLFELETHDKDNMEKVAENYFSAVQAVTGDNIGMTMHHKGWSSKTVYFIIWYNDMKDMAEKMGRQEEMESEIFEKLSSTPLDPEMINTFNAISNPKQSSVWEYVPELSMMEDYMNLPKEERDSFRYRRFQYVNVAMNAGPAYEARSIKAKTMDKERGIKFHLAVFRNIFGTTDANYLNILIDKNRLDYMKNFSDRMTKRRASEDWGKNPNPWDLSLYNVTKMEEVVKNLDFKIQTN